MKWPESESASLLSWESRDVEFALEAEDIIEKWLIQVAEQYGKSIRNIHYIFCSDDFMIEANKEHLGHDYYTDIITFPLTEGKILEAQVLVSIERIIENAIDRNIKFRDELHRVLIHGILHMCGFDDDGVENQLQMRRAETEALQTLKELMIARKS